MAKQLQIGSTIYNYPEQGDKAGWGEDATAWAQGVTKALTNVQGSNDLLITSATLSNNQSSAADIPGLSFNVAEVQAVEIDYFIRRVYDSGTTTTTETGKILGSYDGSEFFISTETTGEAGTEISVLNTGQFQYVTTDLANHTSSVIRFRAKTIDTP
jgi:hypothetical protein